MTRRLEEKLKAWLAKSGANQLTRYEIDFIATMRLAAANGMGYGAMIQMIEWEWQDYLQDIGVPQEGTFGPEAIAQAASESNDREAALKAEIVRLEKLVESGRAARQYVSQN